MPEKARELKRMAAECRNPAASTMKEMLREQLLEVADQFKRLA
jgi:hypothetical protein